MGQSCHSDKTVIQSELNQQSNIDSTDIIKAKLKHTRDRINVLISKKRIDQQQIDKRIKQKIPHYKQTGKKREILPLLQAKKSINEFIQKGEVRIKLINNKLSEVQMQQINKDTINVLDDANKYLRIAQSELQNKNWRGVLQDAEHKYYMDWGYAERDNIQNHPTFQKIWNQLGGHQIDNHRNIKVQIPQNRQQNSQDNRMIIRDA